MTDDPRAAAFELVLQARNDADEKYLACYAELVRVTKERDDANREAEFQHARAAKFADMLKAAPPAEGQWVCPRCHIILSLPTPPRDQAGKE